MRNNDSADQNYAYGGKPIGDRQNDVDRLLVDRDEPEEKRFLGTEVAFPDALRFKGAAPEIANSRYTGFMSTHVFISSVCARYGTIVVQLQYNISSNAFATSLCSNPV